MWKIFFKFNNQNLIVGARNSTISIEGIITVRLFDFIPFFGASGSGIITLSGEAFLILIKNERCLNIPKMYLY